MNVMFTCAGRRNYLLNYFRNELEQGSKIIATDMLPDVSAFLAADVSVQVPSVYAEDYIEVLKSICRENKVDLIISLNDLELPILASKKREFEALGVRVLISDSDIVNLCSDKYKTDEFVRSIGLCSPKTYMDFDSAVEAIRNGELSFPLILKPRWGSGSIAQEFVEKMEEFEFLYRFNTKKVYGSTLAKACGEGSPLIVQEKLVGTEYGLDVFNDFNGVFRGVSVKKKLSMRCGETERSITVKNEELEIVGETIGKNLKQIGVLDCDIIEQDGKYYILDLNPRFGGGYPFSHEAGVNFPKAIVAWMKGEEISGVFSPMIGKTYTKCDSVFGLK